MRCLVSDDWNKLCICGVKIIGTKTQHVANPTRCIIPLPEMSWSILIEFYEQGRTEYAFTRSGGLPIQPVCLSHCHPCAVRTISCSLDARFRT